MGGKGELGGLKKGGGGEGGGGGGKWQFGVSQKGRM